MSNRREYEIAFVGLKPGVHEFDFVVDNSFFEDFGVQDFSIKQANVKLLLEKNATFLILRFQVGGTAEVTCDRCSNNLPLQLFEDFTITVKMTEDPEAANATEEDPDVYYISRGESHIDVKAWLYEFVNLSIPMQKTCQYEAMDGPFCDPAAREVLKSIRVETAAPKETNLWKGLEQFKNLGEN